MTWGWYVFSGIKPVTGLLSGPPGGRVNRTDSEGSTRGAEVTLCLGIQPMTPSLGYGVYTPIYNPTTDSVNGRRYDYLIAGWNPAGAGLLREEGVGIPPDPESPVSNDPRAMFTSEIDENEQNPHF
jgi:hypothetical protein